MSFKIRNLSASAVEIDDLGIYIGIGEEHDLRENEASDIAASVDLVVEINNNNIIVIDPLEIGSPLVQLTKAESLECINFANDAHYRIHGATISQLDDVSSSPPIDGQVLTFDTTNGWQPENPVTGVTDHILLSNIGTNTHPQIDAHIADTAGHFSMFPLTFASGGSTFNKWLSYPGENGLTSNVTPAVVPFDSKLIGIIFSNGTDGSSTDVEIYVAPYSSGNTDNIVLTWQLRTMRVALKTTFASEILFSAGDKIGIYCKKVSSSSNPSDVAVAIYLQPTTINTGEQTEDYSGNF